MTDQPRLSAATLATFGLFAGQIRDSVFKGWAWYTNTGQFLGSGDLHVDDLDRINERLHTQDGFVALHEPIEDAEGIALQRALSERAGILIAHGQIFYRDTADNAEFRDAMRKTLSAARSRTQDLAPILMHAPAHEDPLAVS